MSEHGSENRTELMLEFKVNAKEFKKAVRLIISGRTESAAKDAADFTVVADELQSWVFGQVLEREART